MTNGLIVDLFAGGGGTSLGLEWALGRSPDIAINHDREAIAMHMANHPETLHYTEDVRKIDIRKVVAGRPVAFLWLSPDCKHHSKAKGGKPVDRKIRGLAWEGVRWARLARPSVIILENVEEFRDWGPLDKRQLPDPARKGFTFRRYVNEYRKLGYAVEVRELVACNYGSPTTRKRLFFVARCDGQPIVWPAPTHSKGGRGGRLPLRTAAECIDWKLPCPSIFERERPLAEKTLWRIAQGIRRFVLENPQPFVIRTDHHKSHATNAFDPEQPLGTITSANGHAVVVPSVLRMAHGEVAHDGSRRRGHGTQSVETPLPTVTGSGGGGGYGVLAPSLIKVNHGKREARGEDLQDPMTTVTATQRGHALVAPTLIQTGFGEREGQAARVPGLDKPLGTAVARTVVCEDHQRQLGDGSAL